MDWGRARNSFQSRSAFRFCPVVHFWVFVPGSVGRWWTCSVTMHSGQLLTSHAEDHWSSAWMQDFEVDNTSARGYCARPTGAVRVAARRSWRRGPIFGRSAKTVVSSRPTGALDPWRRSSSRQRSGQDLGFLASVSPAIGCRFKIIEHGSISNHRSNDHRAPLVIPGGLGDFSGPLPEAATQFPSEKEVWSNSRCPGSGNAYAPLPRVSVIRTTTRSRARNAPGSHGPRGECRRDALRRPLPESNRHGPTRLVSRRKEPALAPPHFLRGLSTLRCMSSGVYVGLEDLDGSR